MEEQSQVEELQKNLQEQGSKADDVSKRYISHICWNGSSKHGGVTLRLESAIVKKGRVETVFHTIASF